MKLTHLSSTEQLRSFAKSVYLDLIGSWDALPPRIAQAFEDISSESEQRRGAFSSQLRLTRAPQEMIVAKLAEAAQGPEGNFAMYGVDATVSARDIFAAAVALAPYLTEAGVRQLDGNRFTAEGFGQIEVDDEGNVTVAPEIPSVIGKPLLAVMAAFSAQDFGVVIRQPTGLRYAFDCSAFEKTPKDVDSGQNHYVGLDFLEWHRRIPKLGKPLADLFERLDHQFSAGALDLFTIDLRGRNLYTDGKLVLQRYERDYVVPLRHPTAGYLGFVNFADVFMREQGEERRPHDGGSYFEVGCPREFHRLFPVIKHAAFRPHPTGMREPLAAA